MKVFYFPEFLTHESWCCSWNFGKLFLWYKMHGVPCFGGVGLEWSSD